MLRLSRELNQSAFSKSRMLCRHDRNMDQRNYEAKRQQMIEKQIRARGVKDERVLNALFQIERHQFVLPGMEGQAYEDTPHGIGERQTISQPYIVALMTELAQISPDSKVLEVGTGSGYQTAVLSVLAREVF